jgi:hypothetical protein
MPYVKPLLLTVFILLIASASGAATYVPLDDDAYGMLARLEAEGVIESGLTSAKPLSRREMARLAVEAEKNSQGKSEFVRSMARHLKERFNDELVGSKFIKPVDSFYLRYAYNSSDSQALVYNNDGDRFRRGSNGRAGFDTIAELDWLSFYIAPEVRYPDNDTEPLRFSPGKKADKTPLVCGSDCNAVWTSDEGADLALRGAYGVVSFLGLDLTVGKDSQWWGPGYHGALLLSNNAEPFTMVRLENPQPVLLPWILKYLGPFRWTFFVTKLEDDRHDVPHPYFWGMRVDFKPHPYVEVGLERTAMLCGEGRACSAGTWWRSFTGTSENVSGKESGDQKAGFDVKVTLPFRLQPVQLYTEIDGEDEANGLPSRLAYLAGLYLPRILDAERLDFRVEYATNRLNNKFRQWYDHHIYTSGYTYDGRIIGHHMGSDSSDLFAEMSYRFTERGDRVAVAYDHEEHNLANEVRAKKDEASVRMEYNVTKNIKVNASYGHARLNNFEDVSGSKKNVDMAAITLVYSF